MRGATVFIDDAANGGSDPGAWLIHIAHTPALRAQCDPNFESAACQPLRACGATGEAMGMSPPACPPRRSSSDVEVR